MYDPILCMNVPDSVKTKDETFIIEAKKEGKVYKAIVNGNEQELRKYYSHKGFTDIVLKQTKGKDSKTIDTAIKTCDSPYIKNDELKRVVEELENLASRISSIAERADDKNASSLKRNSSDIKEVANSIKRFIK